MLWKCKLLQKFCKCEGEKIYGFLFTLLKGNLTYWRENLRWTELKKNVKHQCQFEIAIIAYSEALNEI